MTSTSSFASVSLCVFLAGAAVAQRQVVDYEDSTLAVPPQTAYPFYTPGVGSLGQTVRLQMLCPATFAGLPNAPAFVTRIGFQIAGQEVYSTFVLRAGTAGVPTLGTAWATNLPDQRVQRDLSGQRLLGGLAGSTQVNQWVEYELDHPFFFKPGDAIVVDVTSKVATAYLICGTALGQSIARAVEINYVGGPHATQLMASGGIKMRFVFEPLALVEYGSGCAGTGGYAPKLRSTGLSQVGSAGYALQLQGGLGGASTAFALGVSRRQIGAVPLPLGLGGGCSLQTSAELVVGALASGTGAGLGTATLPMPIPNDATLLGTVLHAQLAQVDSGSVAMPLLPVTTSAGGTIVIF